MHNGHLPPYKCPLTPKISRGALEEPEVMAHLATAGQDIVYGHNKSRDYKGTLSAGNWQSKLGLTVDIA